MDDPDKPSSTRARRRILSCSHCRRLKSRCEYDPHMGACRRCHKLRINCSLRNDSAFAQPRAPRVDTPVDTDSRLCNVEATLASIQDAVSKILHVLQPASAGASPLAAAAAAAAARTPSGPTPAPAAQRHAPPSDGLVDPSSSSSSAPIAVVRTFRPNARRLYEQPSRDIVAQAIVDEAVAERLIACFLRRLGRVVQVATVADLVTPPPPPPTTTTTTPTARPAAASPSASLRQASPLLHAVCCLQALRFVRDDDDADDDGGGGDGSAAAGLAAGVHRPLYEAVRRMLGQVVLATPVPLEELYAMLIMCTFEAAPRPVFEYIESWHLSGICAQQALSTIHFAEIVARLDEGRHDARDRRCLSLWNNICLVHLRFAVGTGKPATIPPSMLELCAVLLDHAQATAEDGMVVAEMELLRALGGPAARPQLDAHGTCPELTAWEQKWDHLLKIESASALPLRFVREFAYLVLAMRLVDQVRAAERPRDAASTGGGGGGGRGRGRGRSRGRGGRDAATAATTADDLPSPQVFQATAHQHALAVARLFLATPTARVQELPKFHHICIAYCAIVLAEGADHAPAPLRAAVCQVLADVCTHYRRFADELPAVMHAALARMRLDLGPHTALAGPGPGPGEPAAQPAESGEPPGAAPLADGSGLPPAHDGPALETTLLPAEDASLDYFPEGLGVPSFLTVDDFFGTWMMDAGGF